MKYSKITMENNVLAKDMASILGKAITSLGDSKTQLPWVFSKNRLAKSEIHDVTSLKKAS
ncbi:hypothetical protein [Thalassolituus sp.]|jgi:hypothetical protein|uniref:hypothetical protein n=1 Tax=Thalassolituus sp. TaxID=2030822 RepID=UPI0032D97C93